MDYTSENIEKIRAIIDAKKKDFSINKDSFILYQINITIEEVKEPEIRDLILQPEFTYEKMQYLRLAYVEKIPLDILKRMSELDDIDMKFEKEKYLRRKYYLEKESTQSESKDGDHPLLIKTIEVTIDQVHMQLEENRKITQFLMDTVLDKKAKIISLKKELEVLKKQLCQTTQKPFILLSHQLEQEQNMVPDSNQAEDSESGSSKVQFKEKSEDVPKLKSSNRKNEGVIDTKPIIKRGFFKKSKKNEIVVNEKDELLDLLSSFDVEQIRIITSAYEAGLSLSEIRRFAKEGYSADKMYEIRQVLLKMKGLTDRVQENDKQNNEKHLEEDGKIYIKATDEIINQESIQDENCFLLEE